MFLINRTETKKFLHENSHHISSAVKLGKNAVLIAVEFRRALSIEFVMTKNNFPWMANYAMQQF